MKIIEAYTPADIRACGAILKRVVESGRTIEQFREFAATIVAQAANPEMRKYRLRFKVDDSEVDNNEDILTAIGLTNLRVFIKLGKVFDRRGIDSKAVKTSIKRLRKIELEGIEFGRQKE